MAESTAEHADSPEIFGHPTGLFMLFFAEMWERFSYYGMRALLLFYMIKGFLGMNDGDAYKVYGAYTALVYVTPYFGGLLADRVLGRRRAVVLGGLLMAAGHLLMGYENKTVFFAALAFLIVGNGFFKPNISTIVGELYKKPEKKDAGFTIFYMGINLGAAMSPIVCGYVGETYGWHYGFGLATAGMLVGVAVFVMPTRVTQLMIGLGAVVTSISMLYLWDNTVQLAVRIFMAIMLTGAGVIALAALNKGPLPAWAGQPPSIEALKRKVGGFLPADISIYLGSFVAVGVLTLIVQNKTIAAYALTGVGALAILYMLYEAIFKCTKVWRDRLFVVLILAVFHCLFWAFFEQAGTSLNNWTDRNIDRVFETQVLTDKDVGTDIKMSVLLKTADEALDALPRLTQEQLGHENADPGFKALVAKAVRQVEAKRNEKREPDDRVPAEDIDALIVKIEAQPLVTMTSLVYLREAADPKDPTFQTVNWKVGEKNVGMAIGTAEMPASEFQAANPVYILLFGLLFTALWTFLGRRGKDPTPPVKFALGLAQLGLGFLVFYWGAQAADGRGSTTMMYLLLGWILLTTGELCISPVGLSMVTKLAPPRLVSTVMGVWFVSITYANYFAAIIASFTTGGHGEEEGLQFIGPPQDTVHVYGDVFQTLGYVALGAAVVCFLLKFVLNPWMHIGVATEEDAPRAEAPAAEEPDEPDEADEELDDDAAPEPA